MLVKKRKKSVLWSPEVKRVYQKYPASFKSDDWDEIVYLANHGDINEAFDLAKKHEDSHKSFRAQNIIARRIRIQRTQLFKIQREHLTRISGAFEVAGQAIARKMIQLPNTTSSIGQMRKTVKDVVIDLRRALNTITTDLIWQSVILGVKNMGEAIKPIIRDNQESFQEELIDVALIEERLSLGLSKKFSNQNKGEVVLGSDKWQLIMTKIYNDITKKNNSGLNVSQRIWDLTNRAEQDLKRILSADIAAGKSSRQIADRVEKYIFTKGVDEDFQAGPGLYRSPLKNALRVARTETNRAYTQATAAWADNKPWVKAIRVTLSPAHDVEDDCDDIAGEEYSPEEFADVIPVHPHCMCFGTYVIDEQYLTGDQTGDQTQSEEE